MCLRYNVDEPPSHYAPKKADSPDSVVMEVLGVALIVIQES